MRKERLILRVANRSNLKDTNSLSAKSIDIVGDIAILKMPQAIREDMVRFAQTLLEEAPSIKVVYMQTGPVTGDFRLRDLEWLAGEKRSSTIHREHGCQIEVDIEKDYFSPRLAFERTRIAKQVKDSELSKGIGEIIVNMFAGVGSFSLRIAKETRLSKSYSIDINSDAFLRMFRNVLANKMLERIVCVYCDAALMTENLLKGKADRVLMPLPERSLEYLPSALATLKSNGGTINLENFTHAGKEVAPVSASKASVEASLKDLGCKFKIESERVIRSVGPGWYQVAHDIKIASISHAQSPG